MGNSISTNDLYSPPSPPTPLSEDKCFWIPSTAGDDGQGQGEATGETCNAKPPEDARMIPVVYIPAKENAGISGDSKAVSPRRHTILYCHGHDCDLGAIYDFLVHLSKLLRVDVMSFDYAGGGKYASNDIPFEEQCYRDVLACYNFLIKHKDAPPQNIILYGKGLGSGPVCWLAHKLCQEDASNTIQLDDTFTGSNSNAKKKTVKQRIATPVPFKSKKPTVSPSSTVPLGGIILHSACLSILRLKLGTRLSRLTSLGGDVFCNLERMEDMDLDVIKLPVYFIHGKTDEVIPFTHGKTLYKVLMAKRNKGFPPFWADGKLLMAP